MDEPDGNRTQNKSKKLNWILGGHTINIYQQICHKYINFTKTIYLQKTKLYKQQVKSTNIESMRRKQERNIQGETVIQINRIT